MHKLKSTLGIIILTIIPLLSFAQTSTNSPYTRYGIGKLADKSFAAQRGMGGIGYGLRDSKLINPMNPASVSSVDSMTFMMDVGVSAQLAWFEDGENKSRQYTGSLEYAAIQVPLWKGTGLSFGLEPVSYVGYKYGDSSELPEEDGYSYTNFSGSGGFSKVYGSFSYDFASRVALGVKVAYLFGNTYNTSATSFGDFENTTSTYNTIRGDTLTLRGLSLDFGVQYVHPIDNNRNIVFGAVYTPKLKTNGVIRKGTYAYNSSSGAIINNENFTYTDSIFEMPETYGVGLTFNKINKFRVGADFTYQKWEDVKFELDNRAYNNVTKVNVGGEFIPNHHGGNYFQRIRYRAGLQYSDSYIQVNNGSYKEYGASVGLGIPMVDRRSFLNLAFEYTKVKPEYKTMIGEQYFKVTLSYTFNELWFQKRRLY